MTIENNPLQMDDEEAERKLAVIMFTDIKGFSKKMAENEAGAFDLLKQHDALLRVLATKYGGKVIKSIGDSFMVDFASAVNAVKCGIETQLKFHEHNEGKSEFERIEIRIGIHLGDVLMRDNDIFGDGVNVASRIESITAPTRVCISSDVYNQIRKRMDVQVFRVGNMRLKNIPEPVEIFEILIPDIPEFAVPSSKAAEESKKQELEAVESHANRVSGHESMLSQFHQQALLMSDEEKQAQAEEMYGRAEKFFQMGRVADAEAELKKVEELVPSFQPSETKRKEEEEKESEVQSHLTKARSLINDGELDKAEEETRKVFEYYPLHVGAQQILVRIEEERYKIEEEERLRQAAERRKEEQSSEEQQQVSDILEEVQKLRDEESFTKAIYRLRDIFVIDPNNSTARTLETEIRAAQEEKAIRDRKAAEEEERRLEEERLERRRRRKQEQEARKVELRARTVEKKKKGSTGLIVLGIALIAFGGILYALLPTIMRTFFPVRITVAAIPFTGTNDLGLTHGIPLILLEDLSRVNNVSIRAATTSFPIDPRSFTSNGGSNPLNVTHILTGSYEMTDRGTELAIRLVDVRDQSVAFARRLALSIERFPSQRSQIVDAIIDDLGIDGTAPTAPGNTFEADDYRGFLESRVRLLYDNYDQLQAARNRMESIIRTSGEFPEALATLAETYARLGRIGRANAEITRFAVDLAEKAVRDAPSDPIVILGLATSLVADQRHVQAMNAIDRGLALTPQHAEFLRLKAELFLIAGDYESAAGSISQAVGLDPNNPRTYLVKGWYAHRRGENTEASRQYEAAINAGGDRSYIISSVLASAWLRGTNRDAAVEFYASLASARSDDYVPQYLLGRAFAEKLDSARIAFRKGLDLVASILETDPGNQSALAYRALFLTRLGRFDDAGSILQRLRNEEISDPGVLYRIAGAYALQKKRDEALEALSRALDIRYSFIEILNPDLATLFDDPDFRSITTRPVRTAQ